MRTLQVDAARSFRGGEGQVLALARGLERTGHPTRIVAQPGSELEKRARSAGLDVRSLQIRGGWDLKAALALARAARDFDADLIHAHDAHSLNLGIVAGRLARRPLVLSRRVDFPLSRFLRFRYRTAPARILAVSSEVARVLALAGVPRARVRVVYDGVDPDEVAAGTADELLEEKGLAPKGLYVGNVASLTDHKGQRYFIEAAPPVLARFPETRFLIAGEGELRAELLESIRRSRLEGKVILLGFVPEVRRLYRALSVFVMSSHLEGLGSAILEAMSAGVPVVATSAGGIPEVVEHERTGLLVPPKDASALARAVARLLEDRALARKLADAAREEIRSRFTHARMVADTLSAYKEIAGK